MATQFYMSSNGGDVISADVDHAGTSSTATDAVELRIGDGTNAAPTQRRVLNILEQFERWIMQGGLDGAGANLPPDRG